MAGARRATHGQDVGTAPWKHSEPLREPNGPAPINTQAGWSGKDLPGAATSRQNGAKDGAELCEMQQSQKYKGPRWVQGRDGKEQWKAPGRDSNRARPGQGQGEASLEISTHNNCNAIVFYVPDPTRIEACRGPRGHPAHYLPKHVCRTAVQKIPACLISKKSLVLSPQSVL